MYCFKHLNFEKSHRLTRFPYQIAGIGYARSNPQLAENTEYTFPDRIEICIRMLSEGEQTTSAHMMLGGQEYAVGYPHAVIKLPNTRYIYRQLAARDVIYFAYPTQSLPLLNNLGLCDGPLAWDISLSPDVAYLLNCLDECLRHSSATGGADQIDLKCLELMLELLLQRSCSHIKIDPEREKLMRIDSFLRLHFMDDINLEELAHEQGMSRTTFFRKWSFFFDDTPSSHLLELRLQEAARLLLESHYRVNEIAAKVNIPDSAYFCTLFKKRFGVTPAEYRRH